MWRERNSRAVPRSSERELWASVSFIHTLHQGAVTVPLQGRAKALCQGLAIASQAPRFTGVEDGVLGPRQLRHGRENASKSAPLTP